MVKVSVIIVIEIIGQMGMRWMVIMVEQVVIVVEMVATVIEQEDYHLMLLLVVVVADADLKHQEVALQVVSLAFVIAIFLVSVKMDLVI